MKVKVISLPYIFQVLYVLCCTRPRYQVSVYRTIGPQVPRVALSVGLNHETSMIREYEKKIKLSIRNMEREDIEICKITLKLIFRCNPRSRSGFLVYRSAPEHV